MAPAEHDRIVASVSHLPHLAAAAVARTVSEREGLFAGGGFIDTTRIASGNPGLWRDICESNAREVSRALDELIGELQQLRELFDHSEHDGIEQYLQEAKDKRDAILARRGED